MQELVGDSLKQNEIAFLTRQNSAIYDQLLATERQRDECSSRLSKIASEVAELQQCITTLENAIGTTSLSLRDSEAESRTLSVESEIHRSRLAESERSLDAAESRRSLLIASVQSNSTRQQSLQSLGGTDSFTETYGQIRELESSIAAVTEEAAAVQSRVTATRLKILTAESDQTVNVDIMMSNISVMDKKIHALEQTLMAKEQAHISESEMSKQLSASIKAAAAEAVAIRGGIESVFNEREMYIKKEVDYQQQLDRAKFESENRTNELRCKSLDLQSVLALNTDSDDRLRTLKQKEYSLLEDARGVMVNIARIENDNAGLVKKYESHHRHEIAMANRLKELIAERKNAVEDIQKLRQANSELQEWIFHFGKELSKQELLVQKRSAELRTVDGLIGPSNVRRTELSRESDSLDVRRKQLEQSCEDLREQVNSTSNALSHQDLQISSERLLLYEQKANLAACTSTLNRAKRVSMPGESAQLTIESEEHSALLERLRINSSIQLAQSQLCPTPGLVQCLSTTIDELAGTEMSLDSTLSELSAANKLVSSLRIISSDLCDTVQNLHVFKKDILSRYLTNIMSVDGKRSLNFDSLRMQWNDVICLLTTSLRPEHASRVASLSFEDNELDEAIQAGLDTILQTCPSLSNLNLSRNRISLRGVDALGQRLRTVGEYSSVNIVETDGGISFEARSGRVVLLTVSVLNQYSDFQDREVTEKMCVPVGDGDAGPVLVQVAPPAELNQNSTLTKDNLSQLKQSDASASNTRAPLVQTSPVVRSRVRAPVPPQTQGSFTTDSSFRTHVVLSKRRIIQRAARAGIRPL